MEGGRRRKDDPNDAGAPLSPIGFYGDAPARTLSAMQTKAHGQVDDQCIGARATHVSFTYALRNYQQEAVTACIAELTAKRAPSYPPKKNVRSDVGDDGLIASGGDAMAPGRCILHMACRTGKTPVAHRIAAEFVAKRLAPHGGVPGRILFLVPSLPLAKQVAEALAASGGFANARLLVVGSGTSVDYGGHLLLPQTTSPDMIARYFMQVQATGADAVVVSTYQSCARLPLDTFSLIICDEAHRLCFSFYDGGNADDDPAASQSSTTVRVSRAAELLLPARTPGAKLFMTATPHYGDRGGSMVMTSMSSRRLASSTAAAAASWLGRDENPWPE